MQWRGAYTIPFNLSASCRGDSNWANSDWVADRDADCRKTARDGTVDDRAGDWLRSWLPRQAIELLHYGAGSVVPLYVVGITMRPLGMCQSNSSNVSLTPRLKLTQFCRAWEKAS